jgi:hypothetical protein
MGPTKSEMPLHRHFLHYSELPYSQRVLYTAALLVLGMGYLFALLNVYFTYAGRAGGNPEMLTPADLIVAYSGSGKGSRLESALRGPMSVMLPADERNIVIAWAAEGGPRPAYEKTIAPLLQRYCMTCHDGSNPHLPNLNGYDNLKKMTEKDTGAAIATLVRVSHIHLFGMTFIFFLTGLMFTHAYVRPVWFKCTVIAVPFAGIMVDVSSWYMIKVFHPFVYLEIFAGMALAACFAFMFFVTLYQMWISSTPDVVQGREQSDISFVGGR